MKGIKKIYKAVNKLTQEIYIGATSKSIKKRIKDHLQKANKEVGGQFQNAIKTFGPEAFEWSELDTAATNSELAEKERQYVIQYKAREEGYNSDRGGGIQKNIYQYDLKTGIILSTYSSLFEAAESIGVDRKTISKACLGEIKNCGGYSWSYTLDDNYKPVADQRKKKVFQFSEGGLFLRSYDSVAEASEISGVNRSSIAKCCRGIYSSAGNYLWKY